MITKKKICDSCNQEVAEYDDSYILKAQFITSGHFFKTYDICIDCVKSKLKITTK